MTRYTIRIKATIFVVLTTRYRKLTNRTDGDGTQSEHIVKQKQNEDAHFLSIGHEDLKFSQTTSV